MAFNFTFLWSTGFSSRRLAKKKELELELESASSFIQFNLTAGSHVGHGGMSSKAVRDTCKMR